MHGPDEFSMGCIKSIWPIIKHKVMDCFANFSNNGSFPAGLNSSSIALISKLEQPKLVTDFRPISLMNSLPKLFMKMLTEAIGVFMNKLIGENQYGFMKGRQVSESISIVNVVCHSLSIGKAIGLILKIDFEKAFNSVNWSFLTQALAQFGFGTTLIDWIKNYYREAKMSVLVNGSATKEFSPSRGLRQGDPLSPLLFILVVEVLSSMIKKAVHDGTFKGIKLAGKSNVVTHVQFADDTLIFVNDDLDSLKKIKKILVCFQLLSRLKINFFKSKLFL